MAGFLPSAQFIRVVGALAVVVGGITLAYYFSSTPSEITLTQSEVGTGSLVPIDDPLLKQAADIDTDGDGLRDWEERLWKTNVLVKDSDGDGTSDTQEIEANRNPLVKGPNDQRRDTIDLLATYEEGESETLNTTDKVAREFFVEYLSYKKGGRQLTDTELNSVINNAIAQVDSVTPKPTVTLSQISTIPDSPEAFKTFGNSLGKLYASHPFIHGDERIFLKQLIETGDLAALAKLQSNATGYATFANELLATPSPQSVAKLHLNHVIAMQKHASMIAQFAEYVSDPLETYGAVSQYEIIVMELMNSIKAVQKALSSQKTTFGITEDGYEFMSLQTSIQ